MINIGIVQELDFISKYYKDDISASFSCKGKETKIFIRDGTVHVEYEGIKIWEETVHGESHWFGVESCDRIHKIMACIDNKDDSWKSEYAWRQPQASKTIFSLEKSIENSKP